MIDHLDHLVLTTANEAACVDFYTRVLGMTLETFVGGSPPVARKAFKFGAQKINRHVKGSEFEPRAHLPVPGTLDLCFLASVPLADVITRLANAQWPVIEGPVLRPDPTQKIRPVNVRDPDLNLIEISEPARTSGLDLGAAAWLNPVRAQLTGKLKALTVTGRARLAALPGVPTATETGVPLVASSWFAVCGPNRLSVDRQNRLSLAIRQVVESDNFKKRA